MQFPLMRNNILREDLDAIIAHLQQDDPILTNGPQVKAFEAEWSQWLAAHSGPLGPVPPGLQSFAAASQGKALPFLPAGVQSWRVPVFPTLPPPPWTTRSEQHPTAAADPP